MGTATENKPKCLTMFRGKTLLERALESAVEVAGPANVIVVGGYRIEMLKNYHDNVIPNNDWRSTNIMGSLLVLEEVLLKEDCLIVYSDIIFDVRDLKRVWDSSGPSVLSVSNWREVWATRFNEPLNDLESFKRSENGKLKEIGVAAGSISEIEGQFAGIYKLNPPSFKSLVECVPDLENQDTTSCLNLLPKLGIEVSIVDTLGEWAEFDTQEDIEKQGGQIQAL